MEGENSPAKLYMSGETVIVSADGGENVFQGISQDLLQQALQEVTQPGEIQQVKEEPGVYARMDGLMQSHNVSGMEPMGPVAGTAKTEQNLSNKVKLENTDQCSLIIEGENSRPVTLTSQEAEALGLTNSVRNFNAQSNFSGQAVQPQDQVRNDQVKQPPTMVLIPTLQSDGTVAYTVQQTEFPTAHSVQPGEAKTTANSFLPYISINNLKKNNHSQTHKISYKKTSSETKQRFRSNEENLH